MFVTETDPIRDVTKKIANDFPDVHESISDVENHLDQDHVQAVGWTFGRPCYNPGSFQVLQQTQLNPNHESCCLLRLPTFLFKSGIYSFPTVVR